MYGFELVTKEEANKMNLPNASGMFSELYSKNENDINREKKSKRNKQSGLELGVGTSMELEDDPQQRRIFLEQIFCL